MGIRYYAWAIDDDDIEWMAVYPCGCECRDPRPDRREMLAELGTLDLDKSWRDFQFLFDATGREAGRPAGRLVLSDPGLLTMLPYEPTRRLVSAAHVAEAAADLATVTRHEVRAISRNGYGGDGHFSYVAHHLEQAQRYTERLAEQGLGLRYYIG